MFLFFDTETNGLPDYNLDLVDRAQPRILQLACLLTDDGGREMMSWKAPIVPEGFQVDERLVGDNGKPTAFAINKLGNGLLNQYGIALRQALAMFRLFESKATLKVAHNYRFDGFLLKSEHARAGVEPISPPIEKFCTMKAMTEIMKLGPTPNMIAAGFHDKPKSASLAEAYSYVTGGKAIEKAHDALADVRACKEVFFWLKAQGLFKAQPRYVPGERAA